MGEMKQVIVFRKDLKMRTGKIAAQCTHAVKKILFDIGKIRRSTPHLKAEPGTAWGDKPLAMPELVIPLDEHMEPWVTGLFTAIVLTVENEEDLLRAYQMAKDAGMHCSLVTDAGRTEFHGQPTHTAIAIGPAPVEEIDKITGPGGAVPTKLA